MKKIAALLLALVMVLSLAACGSNSSEPTGGEETDNAQQSQQAEQTDKEPENNNGKGNDANTNAAEQEYGLSLPENVKIKTPNGELYKIGNDFMMYASGGYDFYRYNGTCDYDYYYWDNNAFQNGEGTVTLTSFLDCCFKTVSDDCEKVAGDTKEICGKTCQAYKDQFSTFYVDEESGLYFEMWMDGASNAGYAVTEWDTAVTEFPVAAPQK